MEVIEALRTSILEPRDHLHINQMRMSEEQLINASGINCWAMSIRNASVYFISVGCRRAG